MASFLGIVSTRNITLCTAGALAGTFALLVLRARSTRSARRRPPGPLPLPLLGNLLDIPLTEQWITWQAYVERYGDIVYLSALGRNFLLLGSQEAISDLLEKRSNFNNRPKSTMLNDLMELDWVLPLMPFGSAWRRGRKLLNGHIHAGVAAKWEPVQMSSARRFVRDLLASEPLRPMDKLSKQAKAVLPRLVRTNFGLVAVRIAYGIDVRNPAMEAQYVDIPEAVILASSEAVTPGNFWVDFLPWLRFIPAWFPGAHFQGFARKIRGYHRQMRADAVAATKAQMVLGAAPHSIVSSLLESFPHEEDLVGDIGGIVYLAGSDTTVGAVISFFLAALVNPLMQKRAQAELDRVVGRERLPEYSDRVNLPYMEGIMRECLRWLPVLPTGVPHATDRDEEYRGYLIPKGTVIFPLQWSLLHDPEAYPDPSAFSPERYLTYLADGSWKVHADAPDPRNYAFGFGRRVCPGIHIAEQSLFATLAMVLHTIDVTRAKDMEGREVIPDVRVNSGGLSHALPFPYELRMRDDARELVDMCTAAAEL